MFYVRQMPGKEPEPGDDIHTARIFGIYYLEGMVQSAENIKTVRENLTMREAEESQRRLERGVEAL